jgi:tetratricopeptide (TPR) repeat protein
MRLVPSAVITMFLLSPSLTLAAASAPPPPSTAKEQPICKIGGVLPEGWYVFAQDDANRWEDMDCPRPATLEDTRFNVWRTAPAVETPLFACRDTPSPKSYTILEKFFKPDCPMAGINLFGEPIANAYTLVRQAPRAVSDTPGSQTETRDSRAAPTAAEYAAAGNEHFAARRYPEAEVEFRKAGKLEPASADWPALVALALVLQNKYDDAKTEAEVAIRLDPKNAMAHSALAAALGGLALWKDTELEARVSLRLDPSGARGLPGLPQYLLGLSLWYQDKKEQAEEILRQVAATQDRYRGKLAQLLYENGKLDEAETQYRQALKINPGDPFLTQGLDQVLKAKASKP